MRKVADEMTNPIADIAQRQRALAVDESFIVRAPAGAGKTRLLIQRYLALLATVNEPEEIIAITFTRKAAAEMRQRVMNALLAATDETIVEDSQTRVLAQLVIARDNARRTVNTNAHDNTQHQWRLIENQSRLRIQTIDSLNASLTRQMPTLARFGAQPESVDDASTLYLEAASNLLGQLGETSAIADDIETLLTHLDNNLQLATQLIADMLKARDHWLRNLSDMQVREALQATLTRVSVDALRNVTALYPNEMKNETLLLARTSGQNLLKTLADIDDSNIVNTLRFHAENADANPAAVNNAYLQPLKHAELMACAQCNTFPGDEVEDISIWLALADLLLTEKSEWRKPKGINKNIGFPVGETPAEKKACKEMKTRIQALLERLSALPSSDALLAGLAALRALPATTYTNDEWIVLGAIVRLLPHATAHLWTVFGRHGQCDFAEISQAAARALGADDAPTDLALSLDYRIRHLLIDEFQDTSHAQFSLLEKLTRGWQPDDGRTLFLVGDPMQSIYRFREAEVSLFSRAREFGIGNIALTPLTLTVNFRSHAGVVAWVNETFEMLMPVDDPQPSQAQPGQVPYARSDAFRALVASNEPAVKLHWTLNNKEVGSTSDKATTEANKVVSIIHAAQQKNPLATIAILVRNRTHLADIIPALKRANIRFRAVDIDPLRNSAVVEDLFALTRALTHLADRIAWLAILRAPWCGLTLNDLAALTSSAVPLNNVLTPDPRTIWEIINDSVRVATLSADGQARLNRWRDVIQYCLDTRQHAPLREVVENTWLRLKGPACLDSQDALADAQTYLDLLEKCAEAETGGSKIIDLNSLERRMDRLYSGNQSMANNAAGDICDVSIMTIHKAKGLEFDTVIVPSLGRIPRVNERKLLAWSDDINTETLERELLLAPIRRTGEEEKSDSIYTYIAACERAKQHQEDVRLMYVAATRAVANLHLLAALEVKQADETLEITPPKSASLLASIWPAVSAVAEDYKNLLDTPNDRSQPSIQLQSNLTAYEFTAPEFIAPQQHAMRLRLNTPWPKMRQAIINNDATLVTRDSRSLATINFDWAGDTARHIGTIVHALLETIAKDGCDDWHRHRIEACRAQFKQTLIAKGVPPQQIDAAVSRICAALENTLSDNRGRWLLSTHLKAYSEWHLTGFNDGALINIIIDRSFIDDDGTRWIIDFKTSEHLGSNVDAFLDNEVRRYEMQLNTYATLVAAMSAAPEPIKCGLYFPLLGGWREWKWTKAESVR